VGFYLSETRGAEAAKIILIILKERLWPIRIIAASVFDRGGLHSYVAALRDLRAMAWALIHGIDAVQMTWKGQVLSVKREPARASLGSWLSWRLIGGDCSNGPKSALPATVATHPSWAFDSTGTPFGLRCLLSRRGSLDGSICLHKPDFNISLTDRNHRQKSVALMRAFC